MKVLIAYASRHGSTAGIARRLAVRLSNAGHEAVCREVKDARHVDDYDAYVVGSAAYMYHWLKEANSFVRRHGSTLASKPLWLFSSGPLGTDLVDDEGRDIFEVSRPKEFDELQETLKPRGERVFFGAWDPDAPAIGLAERFMKKMPASTEGLPSGDFRDWDDIESWADEIAAQLRESETAASEPTSTT